MAYEYKEIQSQSLSLLDFQRSDIDSTMINVDESDEQPLVTLNPEIKDIIQENKIFYLFVPKRMFDLVFSTTLMILGFPIFCLMALLTFLTSPGPIFFRQQRLGKNQKPFYIYKFRSMRVDAERFGPQLSSEADPRITKWGRVLRRTRLDELPQFWNVLIGDMSIVGPRPERKFFVEKIAEKNPNYRKLHHIKPGITSFGQVAYGYAENVDQMCERMRFDLVYLKSVSFRTDCGVILKTVGVMLSLKGK